MHFKDVLLGIKTVLDDARSTTLSYMNEVKIIDVIPPNIGMKEIHIQAHDHKVDYLETDSNSYAVHKFIIGVILNDVKPAMATADANEIRIVEFYDDVFSVLKSNTLNGLLFSDGIKILGASQLTSKNNKNHKFEMVLECPYVDSSDFTNSMIGSGHLYYGTSPNTNSNHNEVTWTLFETDKIPMTWAERYTTWGTERDDTTLADTSIPLSPTDIQIHMNYPIASGFARQITPDIFSLVTARTKDTNTVYRSKDSTGTSPYLSTSAKAWKYVVSMPDGVNNWIEFVPSGVMLIDNSIPERTFSDTEVTKLHFKIYPIENSAYSKAQRLGYSIKEAI